MSNRLQVLIPPELDAQIAKAAQRSLAESMARSLWPQGIHVALVVVDAVVDLPRTRRKHAG